MHKPRPKAQAQSSSLLAPLPSAPVAAPEAEPCDRCKAPLVSGAFGQRACRNCNPFSFQPCGICGTARIHCCC